MKKSLHTLLICSLVFSTSTIAQNISTPYIPTSTNISTSTIVAQSAANNANSNGYSSNGYRLTHKLVSDPYSLTGKYNTSSRRQAINDNEVCSAVLSGTIHKGKRMTILKTSEGDFIMEKFFVKEWNQYLYASSFDLSSFECQ
jgi:hypothetical protein